MLEVRRRRNDGEIDVTTVHLEATRMYFVNILSTNAAARRQLSRMLVP